MTLRSFVQCHRTTTPEFKTTGHYLIPSPSKDLKVRYVSDRCIFAETESSLYRIYIAECLARKDGAIQILNRIGVTYFYGKEIVRGDSLEELQFVIKTPKAYDCLFSRVNGTLHQVVTGNYFYHNSVLFEWYVRSLTSQEYITLFIRNAVTGEETHYIVPQECYRYNSVVKRHPQPFFLRGELYYVSEVMAPAFKDETTEPIPETPRHHEDPHREEKWYVNTQPGDYYVIHAASMRCVATIPVSKVYTTSKSLVFVHEDAIHYFRM